MFELCLLIVLVVITLIVSLLIFRAKRGHNVLKTDFVSLMVVMGSGGHTSEMLALLKNLKIGSVNGKYSPITFITTKEDELSKQKVRQLVKTEALNEDKNDCQLISITRSRSVGQNYLTSIVSTLKSFNESLFLMLKVRPQLIICNGPAICVPICLAAKLLSTNVCIVFVESFCRTESLSLTAKILYYCRICDHFLVQWPQLSLQFKKSKFIGLLV